MADFEIDASAFSFRRFFSVIVRRKGLILCTYAIVLAAAFAYCFFWPPSYEASVRFLVRNDRQDPIVSSDQSAIQTQSRPLVTEEELNSEAEILRSSEVIAHAVMEAGVDRFPEHWAVQLLSAPIRAATRAYNDYHGKPEQDQVGAAVARVLRKFQVAAEKKTNVIAARLHWGDPRLSKTILEKIRDAYLEKHLAVHQAPQSEVFFRGQLEAKRAELDGLDAAIASIRSGRSLPVVGEEERHAVRQSSELETEWRRVAAQAVQSAARVAELERQMAVVPDRIVSEERPLRNTFAVGNLKTQIVELQRKAAELRTKYKDGNRLVRQNEEELAAAEAMLRSETESPVVDRTISVSRVSEALRQELAVARAEEQSVRALELALYREWQASKGGVIEVSRQGTAIRKLERDRDVALAAVQFYSKRLEEARATDAMNRMHLTNVTPIEAVTVNPLPVKPKIGLVSKLALGLGLLIAIGVAFLVDMLNRRLRTRREVEELLRIPVLAEVPRW